MAQIIHKTETFTLIEDVKEIGVFSIELCINHITKTWSINALNSDRFTFKNTYNYHAGIIIPKLIIHATEMAIMKLGLSIEDLQNRYKKDCLPF